MSILPLYKWWQLQLTHFSRVPSGPMVHGLVMPVDDVLGAEPQRVFLEWDRPLIDSVVDWLGRRPELLAETLVVVPTSNSGRRLRMALSENGGVISPRVVTPHMLFQPEVPANASLDLLAWVRVLLDSDFASLPDLFPNHDAKPSFQTALSIARQLMQLRHQLSDGDVDFLAAGQFSPEKERWRDLATLEKSLGEVFQKWKVADPVAQKRKCAASPKLPPGVRRVVLACVPDPSRLALLALQNFHQNSIPVEVLVHAPEGLADHFDAWGVPLTELWGERVIEFHDGKENLHLCASSAQAADQCVRVLAEAGTPSSDASVTLCDSTLGRDVSRSFAEQDWVLLDVDGESISDLSVITALDCLRNLLRPNPDFASLVELLRLPGAEMFLPAKTTRLWAARQMDNLHQQHLPESLSDALSLAEGSEKEIIRHAQNCLKEMTSDGPLAALESCLLSLLGKIDPDVAKAIEPTIGEVVDALSHAASRGETFRADEIIQLLLDALRSVRKPSAGTETHLDLQGWLEVSYDAAPHLVLAGMHEGCVPDGQADDAFIPDSLRAALNLRDAAGRMARDAFLLEAALESRRGNGRVDAVVAQYNEAGEARVPSRLLMRCRSEELPSFVSHLFREATQAHQSGGAWQRDWQLALPDLGNPYALQSGGKALSPSSLRDYLDCPFRFYLKRVVKMQKFEAGKMEMNAMEFGNICHRVMEVFGCDEVLRESQDAAEITSALSSLLDAEVEGTYGKNANLPIIVQLESARERLRAFAELQAAERADGWRIKYTEFSVGQGEGRVPWSIFGHEITMTIDRIDQHETSGDFRVWDYKTYGKKKTPLEKHLITVAANEQRALHGELWEVSNRGRKSQRRWMDVQLPLYAEFVRQHFKTDHIPQVGYINLPRVTSDVEFTAWEKFDTDVMDHALEWTAACVNAIEDGVFGPPSVLSPSSRKWDDFAELAPDGLGDAFV